MKLGSAIGLGALTGLSEFLPISAPGHLELYRSLSGIESVPALLQVCLYAGLLAAVVGVYAKRLVKMFAHPLVSELKWLILGILPGIAIGRITKGALFQAGRGTLTGVFFLLTGFVLLVGEWLGAMHKERRGHIRWYDALVMGGVQAVTDVCGLSHTGCAIAAGLATGLKHKRAADFTFTMTISALACRLADALKGCGDPAAQAEALGGWGMPLCAAAACCACAVIAILSMVAMVKNGKLKWFAAYNCVLGLGVITWQLIEGVSFL